MNKKATYGFTLIEVMIVVGIIGILAAIAYPAYLRYVTEARRAEAQGFMQELALRQERWRANNTTYGTGVQINAANSAITFYTFDVLSATATTYTIRATPTGTQLARDSACNPVTLAQNGQRGPTGCWKN